MSLKQLLENNKLRSHKTTKEEIANLLQLIKRDIKDSQVPYLSSDRKYTTAYNAVLQSATILLYCKGYKTRGTGHHHTVFRAMRDILGKNYFELSDYFDASRAKRNLTDYTSAGIISDAEADELLSESKRFKEIVIDWIKKQYPTYI